MKEQFRELSEDEEKCPIEYLGFEDWKNDKDDISEIVINAANGYLGRIPIEKYGNDGIFYHKDFHKDEENDKYTPLKIEILPSFQFVKIRNEANKIFDKSVVAVFDFQRNMFLEDIELIIDDKSSFIDKQISKYDWFINVDYGFKEWFDEKVFKQSYSWHHINGEISFGGSNKKHFDIFRSGKMKSKRGLISGVKFNWKDKVIENDYTVAMAAFEMRNWLKEYKREYEIRNNYDKTGIYQYHVEELFKIAESIQQAVDIYPEKYLSYSFLNKMRKLLRDSYFLWLDEKRVKTNAEIVCELDTERKKYINDWTRIKNDNSYKVNSSEGHCQTLFHLEIVIKLNEYLSQNVFNSNDSNISSFDSISWINDLSDIISFDVLDNLIQIEKGLFDKVYLDEHGVWKKSKVDCIKFILSIWKKGYLLKSKTRGNNALATAINFFSTRYQIDLKNFIKPSKWSTYQNDVSSFYWI